MQNKYVPQFWPRDNSFSWDNFKSQAEKLDFKITKKTRIASLGACFNVEIKNFLIKSDFNYLITEEEKGYWPQGDTCRNPCYHASAAWDRVYNTFTFLNILKYTFEGQRFNRFFEDKGQILDLVRNNIRYPDLGTAQKDLDNHILASREALSTCDVLVYTLGLTEIWEDADRGFVIGGRDKDLPFSSNITFRVSRHQENLYNLNRSYEIIKKHNPNVKLLILVSPILMKATFRKDVNIFVSNCNSISTLLSVANEFIEDKKDVYYLPFYEAINLALPRIRNRGKKVKRIWRLDDNRHIDSSVIRKVLKIYFN